MALFDLIPVALSTIALFLLAYWMQGGLSPAKPAWLGAIMIVAGGVLKAFWKLIVVTTGVDIVAMDNALFPLLGGGFTILMVTLILLKLDRENWIWPVAGAIVGGIYLWSLSRVTYDGQQLWQSSLLGMTIGASSLLFLSLSGIAVARKKLVSAILIFLSLAGAFYLTRLARIPEQTLRVQWTAELVNTASQFVFLIGVFLLTRTAFRIAKP